MSDEIKDVSEYKTDEHINFITVQEGIYEGVSYRINDIEFVEKNGKDFLKLDYDVMNIGEEEKPEFEIYLGDVIMEALRHAVKEDAAGEEV